MSSKEQFVNINFFLKLEFLYLSLCIVVLTYVYDVILTNEVL